MLNQSILASLLFSILLTSCDNSSTYTTSGQATKKPIVTEPTPETTDNNFNDFIEKFSTDTAFQASRIKFPLKTKWYDMDNERDSVIYQDRLGVEMMDFRTKKSTGQFDQWEQQIVIDKNNTSATIQIRGIENGIMVDYSFEKINGSWMLVEMDDSST